MQCPACNHDNPAAARFCTACGAALAAGVEREPVDEREAEQGAAQQVLEQGELRALRAEVQRLAQAVSRIDARLSTAEQRLGVEAEGGAGEARPGTVASREAGGGRGTGVHAGGELRAGSNAGPGASAGVEGGVGAGHGPGTGRSVPPPPPPPGPSVIDWMRERDWETVLGGNWLARIGVVALIVGTAFFLKLAFDNEWIGPVGRVSLGIVGGIALIGAGEYWQRRYPPYAQALTGGGIAILYLAIFAAFSFYSLIGTSPAFGFMALVTAASIALALRYDSRAIALLGILGGFATPLLLAEQLPDERLLMAYVLVLDLGVLGIAAGRNWRVFTLLALLGSLADFMLWATQTDPQDQLLLAEGSITAIFLVFVGATTLFHLIWRRQPQPADFLLMVANAVAYFGLSYLLLWDDYREALGGFTIALSLLYALLGYVALRRSGAMVPLSMMVLGIALVLVTIAVPVQLGDQAWTTIAWAAEGTALVYLSLSLRMPLLRLFGYVVFAVTAVRLVAFDTPVALATYDPVINERVLAFAGAIIAMYASAYLLYRSRDALVEAEQAAFGIYPAFLVAANAFTLWAMGAELITTFDARIAQLPPVERFGDSGEALRNAQNLSITALLAMYAAVVLVVGLVRGTRAVRLAGLGLLVIPMVKVFVYDVFTLEQAYRIAAFVGLGVLLLAGGYLYQRYSHHIRGFLVEQ